MIHNPFDQEKTPELLKGDFFWQMIMENLQTANILLHFTAAKEKEKKQQQYNAVSKTPNQVF